METELNLGALSLLPLVIALATAFITRNAIFAILSGCVVGVVMIGIASQGWWFNPVYIFSDLLQGALNGDFIWVTLIVVFIGMLFELFKASGVIARFADKVSRRCHTPRQVKTTCWALGFVVVDDYFSPLIVGPIMRPLSDRARISREKLAYILDSTTASVCVLVPFMSWGAYLSGLIAAEGGPVSNLDQAISVFAHAIAYNFYPMLALAIALLVSLEVFPDIAFMRRAESRARTEGKVLRDGAVPMVSDDGSDLISTNRDDASLLLDLALPIAIVFGTILVSYFVYGNMKIAEAFMLAVFYLSISLFWRRVVSNINELMDIGMRGIKNVMPAIVLMGLAYAINDITRDLRAAEYILETFAGLMTPALFVATTFLITSLISFSTGTSWGAYALMIPFVLPIAYDFSGNVASDPLVYQAIAAVVGGGIFGDHSSPVSDTSVLSSVGAGSDHMDHVITQLPYALLAGGLTLLLYLLL
ncbi:MAG: Na+/H+ antiporter NhaC family protein [Gammaproteobacteria bacterium]